VAQIYLGMSLPDFTQFDAIIPGGGPMGVYEIEKPEYAYILREADYLKHAIDAGYPVLGICFGHQLIAHILGGEVVRDEANREIGWFDINVNDQGKKSDLFQDVPTQFNLFEYHNDRITRIPPDTKVLATSGNCDVQALEYEKLPVRSVQFHPEISAAQGDTIFKSLRDKLSVKGYNVDSLISQSKKITESARRQLFSNFINLVK
jgi:GMP synthase-like glutamine amidotransferase